MKHTRLSPKFRAKWASLLACLDYETAERKKLDDKGAEDAAVNAAKARYHVAEKICARWQAAGFTSVRLEAGLPWPELPHPAAWDGEGLMRRCLSCATAVYKQPLPPLCPGPPAFNAVLQALWDGVPFGMRGGLPTAGEPWGDAAPGETWCRPGAPRRDVQTRLNAWIVKREQQKRQRRLAA